jgi:hydroxypyruvate reductase
MADAAWARYGERILRGLVISADPSPVQYADPSPFERLAGGHPVPTEASEAAGRRALAFAQALGTEDDLLILLSGGASALMAVPADGITLDDKRRTTTLLLRGGADIHALNTVRKHLSAIKGGRLAAATRARCRALVISDVIGDDLSVIASGPTVPDASRFADALAIVESFEPRSGGHFPAAVKARLADGAAGSIDETPKPGDPGLARAETHVIGSRRDAMNGAVEEAGTRGYRVVRLDDAIVGEARIAAAGHMRAIMQIAAGIGRPACIVSSGETTVHVTGTGRGGRNQEFALAGAEILAQIETAGAIASVGTDGIDGPTDAAGAYADGTTIDRALGDGLAPDRFLHDNDSYAFFEALGDLIHTGPTGTNVGDLQVILLA